MPESAAKCQLTKHPLSTDEQDRFHQCEAVITAGMQTFVEVGSALLTISDQRLYRETHSTFEEYCRERWSMTARRAYQLCDAAEVVKGLENVNHGSQITTERQARELVKVPAEQRAEVIRKATSNGKVTAKQIHAVVEAKQKPRLRCDNCDEEFDGDAEVATLYECDECGSRFTRENSDDGDSNRCPGCHKFGAKVTDLGCPECNEGELQTVTPKSESPLKSKLRTPNQYARECLTGLLRVVDELELESDTAKISDEALYAERCNGLKEIAGRLLEDSPDIDFMVLFQIIRLCQEIVDLVREKKKAA